MPKSSSRSIAVHAEKLLVLRQNLGWTQEHAATKSGYSCRLIRKIESGGRVRPETLVDVLQCYHVAIGCDQWHVSDFLLSEADGNDSGDASSQQLRDEKQKDQQRQIQRMQQWYTTIYNERQIDQLDDFIDAKIKYQHGQGEVHVGIDLIRKLAASVLNGFNPLQFTFPQSFYSEGYVHTFWHLRMKHEGEFGGVAATGKWVTCRGNSRVKLVNNKMVDAEDNWDVYDVIRQLEGTSPKWF